MTPPTPPLVGDRRRQSVQATRMAMDAQRACLEALRAAKRRVAQDTHLLVRRTVEDGLR